MTLLSVIKDVCATVGVLIPSSVFSNLTGNRTMQEMVSGANEMAQRIAYDKREWTMLKTTVTYPGDGVATAFNLPANYKRMLLKSNVWRSTSALHPMQFVPDLDVWLNRRNLNWTDGPYGEWTIYGGQIHIWPVLATGESAYFAYLNKNCIEMSSGGYSNVFQNDADLYRLDERLLKLGMIWQWKAQKGSPYADDMGTYDDALAYAMGSDGPAPTMIGRRAVAGRQAYPYPTPVEPVVPL